MKKGLSIACVLLNLAALQAPAGDVGSVPTDVADPAASRLEFSGMQAGAEFKGTFHKFTAAVAFSPDALSSSHIDVQIDMGSSDTKDADRDQTMRGAEMLDVAHFPTARYSTHRFTKTADGYSAEGALTLRGITKDVRINFQFTAGTAAGRLEGAAKINRLDFGVGQGEWKSTEWVGGEVKVAFFLALKSQR